MEKNILNTHGIYCLYFENANNKYYIGKSLNIKYRYAIHCRDLRNNVHHNINLQHAYNKYAVYPTIQLLEIPEIGDLSSREIYWIEQFDAFTKGYNRTGGGEGSGYGSTCPSALYDEYTYTSILYMLAYYDMSIIEIANELEVYSNVVTSIALKNSHTYLQNRFPKVYDLATSRHGMYETNRKHTDETYYKILLDLANTSDKYNVIANRYSITEGIVEDIGRGSTHKYLANKYPELYSKMLSKKGARRSGSHSGKEYPAVKSPEGIIYTFKNAKGFALQHGLHQGHFAELLNYKAKSHKGWILV